MAQSSETTEQNGSSEPMVQLALPIQAKLPLIKDLFVDSFPIRAKL
jgi:hypothetical protein